MTVKTVISSQSRNMIKVTTEYEMMDQSYICLAGITNRLCADNKSIIYPDPLPRLLLNLETIVNFSIIIILTRECLRNRGKANQQWPSRSGIAEGRFRTGDTCAQMWKHNRRYAAYFNRDNSGQTSQFVILLLVLP